MVDVKGNIHIHTPYSDGTGYHQAIAEAAIAAGLDFVIVTDHNVWVDGVEGYYTTAAGRVLLLVGEEIHDVRRQPGGNHLLVIGAECELAQHAADPQSLIAAAAEAGGYTFLAHPYDAAVPVINQCSYAWTEWNVEGFTGLELWNYMSNFKVQITSKRQAIRATASPEKYLAGPDEQTLAKWDALLAAGRRLSVIGGSDAHAQTYTLGPITRTVFPYQFLFEAVNTHLLLEEPLTGEFAADKARVLAAVGGGRGWVGYDMARPTTGFRFSAQSLTKGTIGDEVKLGAGATLQVIAPAKADIRIIHDGAVVAEIKNSLALTHIPVEEGAYRAECLLDYAGEKRGWIYSNPIYLV